MWTAAISWCKTPGSTVQHSFSNHATYFFDISYKCILVTPFLASGHVSIAIRTVHCLYNARFSTLCFVPRSRFNFFRHSIACLQVNFFSRSLWPPGLHMCTPRTASPTPPANSTSIFRLRFESTMPDLCHLWHLWYYIKKSMQCLSRKIFFFGCVLCEKYGWGE